MEGRFRTFADVEAASEGPSAQDHADFIAPYLISLLPRPFVPAPDADADSDDDHFSFTSSSSSDYGASVGADWPTVVMAARDDGQDHISGLPNDLLSSIISRLPTNEAARTTVLSTRWRRVWAATPLSLDDAHLTAADEPRGEIAAFRNLRAVSRCVAAHPGPVRVVRVTGISFKLQEHALHLLVASLAAKNVQDLVLFNRPWPLNMSLPGEVLGCASLRRLYLGVWRWRFPGTTADPPAFPNLHELGIFHCIIKDSEGDALFAHCPKLEILSYAMMYICPSRLVVRSRSLRAVMEWKCTFDEVVVDHAPSLERLLFDSFGDRRPVRIVHAPRLEVIGFLDLQLHTLEIGGIVIRAGMNVRASAMLPSLKILAVKVRLWYDMEVKMLSTLLRCFPRLETLHIMSIQSKSPDIVDEMDFWKSLPVCDCLESHLKTFVLHGFQGRKHESSFLHYILKNGKVLKSHGIIQSYCDDVVVEGSDGSSSSDNLVVEESPLFCSVGEGNAPSGGSTGSDDVVVEGVPMSGTRGKGNALSDGSIARYISVCPASPCWSFQNAIDLSVEDPFYVLGHVDARIALVEDESGRLCF